MPRPDAPLQAPLLVTALAPLLGLTLQKDVSQPETSGRQELTAKASLVVPTAPGATTVTDTVPVSVRPPVNWGRSSTTYLKVSTPVKPGSGAYIRKSSARQVIVPCCGKTETEKML